VLSDQLLGSVALQRLELVEHEATVRHTREVVQAAGGVQVAQQHSNPLVRKQAQLFAQATSNLARHRRFQAGRGLCQAPQRRTKQARAAKRERDAHLARARLQQRKAEHENKLTAQRLLEGGRVYYDPAAAKSGNRTFGSAPPPSAEEEHPEEAGAKPPLPAVKLGNQHEEYLEEQRALSARRDRKRAKLDSKRGKGQEGPIGLSPVSREREQKRDEHDPKRGERNQKRDEREQKLDKRFSKDLPEKGHVPQFAKQ
jgi:hypothetical protein